MRLRARAISRQQEAGSNGGAAELDAAAQNEAVVTATEPARAEDPADATMSDSDTDAEGGSSSSSSDDGSERASGTSEDNEDEEDDDGDGDEDDDGENAEEDLQPAARHRLLRLLFGAAGRSEGASASRWPPLGELPQLPGLRGDAAARINSDTRAFDIGQHSIVWGCLDGMFDSALLPPASTEHSRRLLHEQQQPGGRAKRLRSSAGGGPAPRTESGSGDGSNSSGGRRLADLLMQAAAGAVTTRAAAQRAVAVATAASTCPHGAAAMLDIDSNGSRNNNNNNGNSAGFSLLGTSQLLLKRELSMGRQMGFSRAQQRHLHCHRTLPLHPQKVRDSLPSRAYIAQYSSSGDFFIAAFQDRRVRLYDTQCGWRLRKDVTTRMTRWTITDTCLSPDQRLLVYASISPVAFVVNVGSSTDPVVSQANITELHEPLALDGSAALGGAGAGAADGDSYRGRDFGVWSIAWSPQGGQIIAGTNDRAVYVYDIESRACVGRLTGHGDDVNAVSYLDPLSPHLLVSGCDDDLLRVWDSRVRERVGPTARKPQGVLVGHIEGVTHVCAKGDGVHVLSNAKDQSAKLWDVRAAVSAAAAAAAVRERPPVPRFDYRWEEWPAVGCDVARYQYHRALVRDCSWHPYEAQLTSASWDGRIVSWGVSPPPFNARGLDGVRGDVGRFY